MHYQILKEPMAMLEIQLNKEEQLTAEAGAMVYIKGNIEVKTTTRSGGGFFKKFKVAALGRQSPGRRSDGGGDGSSGTHEPKKFLLDVCA